MPQEDQPAPEVSAVSATEPTWFVGSLNGSATEVSATSATEAEWMPASELSMAEKEWTGIGDGSPVDLALAASLVALPQVLSESGNERAERSKRGVR